MNYGWNDRPAKASVRHLIGGDSPAVVYKIGKYEVTVPGEEVEVTYRSPYETGDPRRTFPNMEVADGEVRFPVSDMVDVILSRLDPVDLARELWQNDEVKAEFMRCLAERYLGEGIADVDRRKFLASVQEEIHSVALDRLADKMSAAEYKIANAAHYYSEINQINQTLRELDVRIDRSIYEGGECVGTEKVVLKFDARVSGQGELAIGGKCWTEARDYWREEALRLFPIPSEEEDTTLSTTPEQADAE